MRIGITIGDPAGVGPEVVLKALEVLQGEPRNKLQQDTVIIGSPIIIDELKKRYGIKWDSEVIDCADVDVKEIEYGKVSKLAGRVAYEAILKGYELMNSGEIDALVTAPVCKEAINLIAPDFSGHTELLAKLSNTNRFAMMLAGDKLRVTLITTHIPIKEVASSLSEEEIITKIELTNEFLNRLGIDKPKIGVCALNPHAGEGTFGDEERSIICPAVKKAKGLGIQAEGPYPSDTLFRMNGFDAIVAMYHDQGLIPLKLLEFSSAVNITLGLPFVRTSPAHGVAFDIAGKGVADPGSMINAIKLAQKLLGDKWTS